MTLTDIGGIATTSARSAQLRVREVIDETAAAKSIVFDAPDDGSFDYRPVQFLTLRIPSDRTGSVARCYSLASSPGIDAALKVTVKRTVDGYGSNWLCDNVSPGMTMESLAPAGVFTPQSLTTELVLWAAGSGITPILSILKYALTHSASQITLIYANRDDRSVIFDAELRDLAIRHAGRLRIVHWLESVSGLPSPVQLASLAGAYTSTADNYMCGPGPFMATVRESLTLLGVDRSRVHAEVFTSLTGDPFTVELGTHDRDDTDTDSAVAQIDLFGEDHSLRWPRSKTLLDAMLAKGLDVPFSCREGECGSCAATIVAGEVDMPQCAVLDPEDVADGIFLACQARPVGDEVRIQF